MENEPKTNDRVGIGGERSSGASVEKPEILWKNFYAPKFTGNRKSLVWISAISSHGPGNYSVDIFVEIIVECDSGKRGAFPLQ